MKNTVHLPRLQFRAILTPEGKIHFDFGDFNRRKLVQYIRENPDSLFSLEPVLPESKKQRKYFESALVSMFVFYNGGDYHDPRVLKEAREDLKKEFCPEMGTNWITGSVEKRAKSTKGRKALNEMTEKVYEYLVDNYAVPERALDPKTYKNWRDIELTNGAPINYLDYLLALKIIKRP